MLAAACIWTAALRASRASSVAWTVFAAGQSLWLAGDFLYARTELFSPLHSYPSWADACYLTAYPLLVVGLYRLSQRWGPRDRPRLLDTAIIAAGLVMIYWIAVAGPIVSESGLTALSRFFTVAYPVMAVVLFAVVMPLLTRRSRRTPSAWLLITGCAVTMTCTAGYSFLPANQLFLMEVVFAGYLLTYVCFAGAAMHPSAHEVSPWARPEHFGIGRLLLLTASSMLPAGALVFEGLRHSGQVHWLAVATGSVVLSLLIMGRLAGVMATTRRQGHRLHEMAMRDELTGLPNRRSFERDLADVLRVGAPHVMLLDLNGFKEINDHFGHAVGDRLLVAVAERLLRVLRGGDVVARMGGDEFAVMVRDAPAQVIDGVAERLIGAFRDPVIVDEHRLIISTSIGTVSGHNISEPYEMLRRADLAMYAAKRAQSARHYWYDPRLDENARWRAQIADDLRAALYADQLRVVYQPIVALPEGRIVAVEALVRWQHPTQGMISPADFIPIAEETGIIVELGALVLGVACAQAVVWRNELGHDAPQRMSVNVSARQLAEAGFVQTVVNVLATTGWAAHDLVVEVTETAVFGGTQTQQAVRELHDLGVRIALDDFGTGHSSLGLLQTVPVDVLKVDKSFVDNITMAGRHVVIATALIQLSQGLGLTAVAEGVETAEQANKLSDLGYPLAQGYHFGRPEASTAITETIRRSQRL